MRMTDREIFDKVKAHLLTQMEQSSKGVDEKGMPLCKYRVQQGDKVLMCAVGCLIPEDKYDPKMEGYGISGHKVAPIVREVLGIPIEEWDYRHSTYKLLGRLQATHDQYTPGQWADEFAKVEVEFFRPEVPASS